jgi:hypothetical protein
MSLSFINRAALISVALAFNGCAGEPHGAGYWFHFMFVLIPLVVIGLILFKKTEAISDSLFTIEGQIKKLSTRLDNLEEKLKKLTDKEPE